MKYNFQYLLSEDDITKLRKHLARASFYYVNESNEKVMDIQMTNTLRREFPMDIFCSAEFSQDFDTFLETRKKPYYKIYDYLLEDKASNVDIYASPLDIDFKTDLSVSVAKKTLPKIQGKPTLVEYYEIKRFQFDENGAPVMNPLTNAPNIEYINKICEVSFDFTYDPFGFIVEKIANLRWVMTDETVSEVSKNIGELFDPLLDNEKRIAEGTMRRQAIVDGLQLPALAFLGQSYPDKNTIELLTIGRAFLDKYDEDFRDFVEKSLSVVDPQDPNFGKKVIIVKIEQATDEWLDNTVTLDGQNFFTPRQYIISELDIS
jgi:hypothetical protein